MAEKMVDILEQATHARVLLPITKKMCPTCPMCPWLEGHMGHVGHVIFKLANKRARREIEQRVLALLILTPPA